MDPSTNSDYSESQTDGGGDSGDGGEKVVEEKEEQVALNIAKDETRYVGWLRIIVFVVLLVTTIGVSIAVYRYASTDETSSFVENFEADAKKVITELGHSVDLTTTAVDSLAVALASFARFSNSSWPFVTLPDWELRASKTRVLSKAILLNTYYLIEGDEQRKEWEAYAKMNNGWVEQSINLQRGDPNYFGPIVEEPYYIDEIFDYDENPMPYGEPFYMPMWQQSPAIPIFVS